jgi:hypothetical protein
MFFLQFVTII